MAMEIVKSIVFPIVQCAAVPIWSEISYIIFHNSNFDKLKTQLHKLEEAKVTLQQRVNAAIQKGEEIFEAVQNSLREAGVAIHEANNFLNNEDNERVGCLSGPFQCLWTTHQLSKKSTEMAKGISEIITKVNESINMPVISALPRLQVALPPYERGYKALHSRTSIMNEIMQKLKDDNMYAIGVHGMGGVGKSKLIEEVASQAEKDGSFNAVIEAKVLMSPEVEMATVTRFPKLKKIQDQLADGLGLQFKTKSQQGRARELRDKIIKVGKVLVIMDDIWKKIDLKEVGVPFGDHHKGCKLLFTSRDLAVLEKEMGTQKNFSLNLLSEEESWNLFEMTAGDIGEEYNLQAVEVAKACMGLPLSLVAAGITLRNEKKLSVWKDALLHLRKNDDEGLSSGANKVVELTYNNLKTNLHKSLFILIGSHGETYFHIEDLFMYGWGLGLFKQFQTLADARNKLDKLICDLKASSLLIEEEGEWVKMHDVTRGGAAKLASKDKPTFHQPQDSNLEEWPEIDQLRNFKRIMLNWCYISVLPEILECPELEILNLCSQDNNLKIPTHFFSRMDDLKVLDLGGMICTPSLPPSLGLLKKLRTLSLYRCMLDNITIISKLTSLEILSLEGTEIEELPEEIGQLTHLRRLNLNNCTRLRVIPKNVISSLKHLEELHMGNCHIQWEVEGSHQCNNASLGELRQLNQLKSLEMHIEDILNMPKDLFIFINLEKYKILIGEGWEWCWDYASYSETSRTLKLNLSSTRMTYLDVGIKRLLNRVEDLSLAEVKGARNVVPELIREDFARLKHMLIQNSADILYIINSTKWDLSFQTFSRLESLVIHNLVNLEKIYCGQLTIHTFTKLQVIKVKGCEKLENLFSFSMAANLPQLGEIEISDCKFMTGVIVQQSDEEFEDHVQINLPKIHSIKLESLPNLISLSSNKVAMPNLEKLSLSCINTLELWNDILIPSCLQNLTKLTVDGCGGLKYLFTSSMVISLKKLRCLDIGNCQMMEDIFVNLQSAQSSLTWEEVKFPSLETLVVYEMDNLKSIYNDELASNPFPKLVRMEIVYCKKLVSVFPSYVLNSLCNLEALFVSGCAALKVIFKTQGLYNVSMELQKLQVLHMFDDCVVESIVSSSEMVEVDPRFVFPQLTELKFWYLHEFKGFYHGTHTLDCPSLQILHVAYCDNLEIFQSKSQNSQEVVHGQPLFSSLKAIPRIRELSLSPEDIANICSDDNLYAVTTLRLHSFHDKLERFPISFLQRFTNLDHLVVVESTFTKIFSSEDVGPIITSTTATIFLKLRRLTIRDCVMLEKIVAKEHDSDESEISFKKLVQLELINLPSLTSFCKENLIFNFPLLQTLHVVGCPRMETFTHGILNAPILRKVMITESTDEEWRWEGELNTTITKMFEESVDIIWEAELMATVLDSSFHSSFQ